MRKLILLVASLMLAVVAFQTDARAAAGDFDLSPAMRGGSFYYYGNRGGVYYGNRYRYRNRYRNRRYRIGPRIYIVPRYYAPTAIVARAWAIPLVINAKRILTEALNGDQILVDGDQGIVHLRPEESVAAAFRDKIAMQTQALTRYAEIRDKAAQATSGEIVSLHMNAGLMADLPSLESSGAEGVGLFRTELQFLTRARVPRRSELAAIYGRVMDAAQGKRVVFRTLDIGSDKVLPYMKPQDEPNPAWDGARSGWALKEGRPAHATASADPSGQWPAFVGDVPVCGAIR